MRHALLLAVAALVCGLPVAAQQSAGFQLTESTLNSGGRPEGGTTLTSTSFSVTLDALGQSVAGPVLSGSSWSLSNGFVSGYGPPGEVTGLAFAAKDTYLWAVEPSAQYYSSYRGSLGLLDALDYGACEASPVTGTIAVDGDVPSAGDGLFYLVTATNRLEEEGTKGAGSGGIIRGNSSPCP